MAERPATCSICEKRMSRKHWYYRNGQYCCKKSCWTEAQKKGKEKDGEAAKASSS